MSTISVVVPVYKVEKFLRRCVDSILSQTYKDFDLILVDDGSPDTCPGICDEYANKDDRVHVIHKENGGLSDARNAGIEWAFANSNSEWITFIDSDDWVCTQYLSLLYDAIADTEADMSVCEYERVTQISEASDIEDSARDVWNVEEYFLQHHLIANIACAKLYPKKAFADIQYPVGKIHEDEFTTYKVLFKHSKIAVLHAPLYRYYINPVGIMGSRGNSEKMDRVLALEERVDYFSKTSFLRAYQVSIESCLTVLLRMRNKLIGNKAEKAIVEKKIRHLMNNHVSRLDRKGKEMIRSIRRNDAKDCFVHLPNRLLKICLGDERYEKFKQILTHG